MLKGKSTLSNLLNDQQYEKKLVTLIFKLIETSLSYNSTNVNITYKSDQSPLTDADLAVDSGLRSNLKKNFPHIPYVSEEDLTSVVGIKSEEKALYWLCDPIDGTKEFIKGSGDYTINLALIYNGQSVLGLIGHPKENKVYFGDSLELRYKIYQNGDYLESARDKAFDGTPVLVKSLGHPSKKVSYFSKILEQRLGEIHLHNRASSLKFCELAENNAHIYPRFTKLMIWDIAAGEAILRSSGGCVLDIVTKKDLEYDLDNLRAPHFIGLSKSFLRNKAKILLTLEEMKVTKDGL